MRNDAKSAFPMSLLAAALLFSAGFAQGEGPSVAEMSQKAVALDLKLDAAESLALYLQLEKLQPENPDVLVGIARQYRHLMQDSSSKEEKNRLADLALQYGERAAAVAPHDSDAQLSVAITCGKILPLKSARERVEISRRIKAHVDAALKLDAENDLAWHILGRWHQGYAEVSTVKRAVGEVLFGKLPDSTYEDAAKCFENAARHNPRRLMHAIELGITYARMGKTGEARALLEKALAMPVKDKDDPAAKQRGKEELEKLGAPEVAAGKPAGVSD